MAESAEQLTVEDGARATPTPLTMETLWKQREKLSSLALSLIHLLLGSALIGCGVWHHVVLRWRGFDYVTGVALCGAILVITASFGAASQLLGKTKFIISYCVVSYLLLVAMSCLAARCLSTNSSHIIPYLVAVWSRSSMDTRGGIQEANNCCGFQDPSVTSSDPLRLGHPPCSELVCCQSMSGTGCCGHVAMTTTECPCRPCAGILEVQVDHTLKTTGCVALATAMFMLFTTTWVLVQLLQRYRQRRLESEQESDRRATAATYQRF